MSKIGFGTPDAANTIVARSLVVVAALKNLEGKVQNEIPKYCGTPTAQQQRTPHTNNFAHLVGRLCGRSIRLVDISWVATAWCPLYANTQLLNLGSSTRLYGMHPTATLCSGAVRGQPVDSHVVKFVAAGMLLQAVHSTVGSLVRSRSLSFTSKAGRIV